MTSKENNIGHGLSMNTIYNMDCIEGMKLIPDKSIDCVITDPPYGTTACKRDIVIPFDLMREQLKRIIKPNGAIVLFGSEPFSSALRMSNLKMYKYDWVWDKQIPSGMSYAKHQPMRQTECISVFCGGKHQYNPQMVKRDKPIKAGGMGKSDSAFTKTYKPLKKIYEYKNPTTLLSYGKIRQGSIHPTQKPVALIEYLIKTYTLEGETVLDFTMGSFTTAVACENTNRKWIGIEMSKEYCEIGKKRIIKNRIEKGLGLLDFTSNI